MKIVILDGYSINPGDLSWDILKQYGDITVHSTTAAGTEIETIGDADGIFTSKNHITDEVMRACPNLKFIGELATGYDNIDVEAAKKLGISVYYTPAYSTEAVAQHTIALMLEISNHVALNTELSRQGHWFSKVDFSYDWAPVSLLDGKSLGIIGYGNIGRRVAKIAEALGMKINIYSRNKEAAIGSDIVSLHCPATAENYHMINDDFISQMKEGAILINTARGALIDEEALLRALDSGRIYAAGLDVLEKEPPENNPLIAHPRCFVTPHVAWSPKETRQKVIDTAAKNLSSYLNNSDTNRLA